MTGQDASSPPGSGTTGPPGLADALPGAEHHCRRAVAHLEGRPARGDLLESLVALLEAAGGPDVGNGVRSHLERTGATAPAQRGTDGSRVRVLTAALRLHRAAEAELRDRLRSAGLDDQVQDAPASPSGRDARARYVGRVLTARGADVDQLLRALAGGDLPTATAGTWVDALVGDLPPDASQGETAGGGATG